MIAGFRSFGALDHQRRDLRPIKFTLPLGRSGFILLSSGISYQVDREVYLCAFRFILFPSYSPQKSTKNFTVPDLQPSLSLLHNLVSESVVLNSCPRLSLVAGLDLFWFSFVSSIRCHLPKTKTNLQKFPSIDSYLFQFPAPPKPNSGCPP